jgi:hypothetical protein
MAMSGKDAHLYGARPLKKKTKEISSTNSLAFTSQLSSLISSTPNSSSSNATRGRVRPTKPTIFTSHNKNSKKRALKDLEEDDSRTQLGRQDLGGVDATIMHRSKRKMEEKARLYAAMKRGDYVPTDGEAESLIDFDRKWAENEARGAGNELDTSSDSGQDSDGGVDQEEIEYEDEFGRLLKGTRADKERLGRRMRNQLLGQEELNRMSARPAMPEALIYGPTVQAAAFNPDSDTAAKMEEIARKRDRSMTPPDAVHYEADKEIRTKGVGFYAFSKDEKARKAEMEALERERRETESGRREREEKKEKRKREIEERKRAIAEQRAKKMADNFLDSLEKEIPEKHRESG